MNLTSVKKLPEELPTPSDTPKVLGQQVALDLHDCGTDRLDDLDWVRETLMEAARQAGATIVEAVFHKFSPWGISGVVVISESHLAIHIWPEYQYAAIDIFTCGSATQLEIACEYLVRCFQSAKPATRKFQRGEGVRRGLSLRGPLMVT